MRFITTLHTFIALFVSLHAWGQEPPRVEQYHRFETTVVDTLDYDDPFDSRDITVDALITGPEDDIALPCYSLGEHRWGLRFAPSIPGDYEYVITAQAGDETEELGRGSFKVEASDERGFVRIGESGRHFVFDNGESYFPLGQNMGWVSRDINQWIGYLDECNAAKINWIRVWMCSWGFTELVWSPYGDRYHGLDAYDLRNAQLIEDILREAEERGIYVALVINHHGQYSTGHNPIWNENPYNSANGGYLDAPHEFFTSEQAKRDYRDRLRYLVARYGAFTSVKTWEFWNEVDLTTGFDLARVNDWHEEMAAYLSSIDPYGHLLSTSASADIPDLHRTPGLDFAQTHSYTTGLIDRQQSVSARYAETDPEKPHFFSEMAFGWQGPVREDRTGVSLHNQLWSSVHSHDSGTAMTWWWDNWVRPFNLYSHFRHLADYIDGIDWERAQLEPMQASIAPAPGNRGEFTFVPAQGWAPSDRSEFIIRDDGTVEGNEQGTSFIHGNYHRNFAPNPEYVVTLDAPSTFIVRLQTVASAGAVIRIMVNDTLVETRIYPPGDSDRDLSGDEALFAVPLAAGKNRIKIRNVGNDWVEAHSLTLDRFVQRPLAFARGAESLILLWVHDRAHRFVTYDRYEEAGGLEPTTVTLPEAADGEYHVNQYDPYSAEWREVGTFHSGEAGLSFPLDSFQRDVAFRIKRADSSVDPAWMN